jgi:hypothetical protein
MVETETFNKQRMKFTTVKWFWHNVKTCNRKRFHWRSWKLLIMIVMIEAKSILLTGRSLDELHEDDGPNDQTSKNIEYQKDYYL